MDFKNIHSWFIKRSKIWVKVVPAGVRVVSEDCGEERATMLFPSLPDTDCLQFASRLFGVPPLRRSLPCFVSPCLGRLASFFSSQTHALHDTFPPSFRNILYFHHPHLIRATLFSSVFLFDFLVGSCLAIIRISDNKFYSSVL